MGISASQTTTQPTRATTQGGAASRPWYRAAVYRLVASEWGTAALILAVTRIFALAGGLIGAGRLVQEHPEYAKGWFAEMALMWDAAHYAIIARDGYAFDPAAPAGANVAFAPLFPFLVDLVSGALRWIAFGWNFGNEEYGAIIVAGLLISNASFFVALGLLIKWLRPRLGHAGAALVALALASLPTAFFFAAMYTESLFLALALGAFTLSRSDVRWKWLCVGLLCMLATLTRFAGVVLLPVFVVDYLAQTGWRWRKVRPNVLWLGLVPAGVLLYLGFLWWRFGDPFAMNKSMLEGWRHTTSFFLETYWTSLAQLWNSLSGTLPPGEDPVLRYSQGSRLYIILDLALPVMLLVGGFLARRKLLASEWTWLVLGLIYPLSFNITFSMARYVLPLWPGLVWVGTLRGKARWAAAAAIVPCLLLMAWCAAKYASARWIG
ncbi:MAG TPA: mannosyltransferase family protein [Chloroflexia bacterium]|nr:mannosyltransferase family protein [Chloroflexia bacterium]